ncbi:probable L-alanine-DL-glutamate epimerase and related enzymes of enolase superfamily [Fusarium oxysporum]|uniref:Probable L-alanine-DL-glutamate epimerase and related enzymes of enolase superfamily n=1 Tax=Fusarium oxysporum TaxID=5507 RepID=A0A2H3TFT3_FUSOX|nr:probable L-alanine-DL-glutamate epimerase and related enzymes of enolase superfamily [Fusarium oxysporum]
MSPSAIANVHDMDPSTSTSFSGSQLPASEIVITDFQTYDLRFPTSQDASGSDAMNPAGDYSATHIQLKTNTDLIGHGIAFTIGRGNDLCVAASRLIAERLVGKTLQSLTEDMGKTWRHLVADSQLRWVGPEKGVIHLGLSSCVNALWDLWGRYLGKPVWKIVADMTPEEFVSCIDFRYITDAITPEEAIQILQEQQHTKADRLSAASKNRAVPAYTTQAGWLGFSDDRMKEVIQENLDVGMDKFKFKVGGNINEDIHRLQVARKAIGYDRMLMVDANQVWSVPDAIENMKKLAPFKPVFIEEPTSPDDILGHATIRTALKPYGIAVATGEHCQNRVMFKQFLQAASIDYCQVDACRLGGVNEVMAVMLMAKKFNVPIVPHSGGIGLNEYTQHLALINYVCVSGEASLLEHINSFNEVLVHPVQTQGGYFVTPWESGYSVEYKKEAISKYLFPTGSFWVGEQGRAIINGEKA